MRKNSWSFVLGIALLFLVLAGGWTLTQSDQVYSSNIVGFMKVEGKTINANGEVVTLGGLNTTFELCGTGLPVFLRSKDITFSGEVSSKVIAGITIDPTWIGATGKVERVSVGGQDLALVRDTIQSGCLGTKQYGEVPVYFHYDGAFPSPSRTNTCILVFSVDQVRALRQNLRENEERQPPPSKSPNRVAATNQVPEQPRGNRGTSR